MIINVKSGHSLWIEKVEAGEHGHPAEAEKYRRFFVVRNWDKSGPIFFYLATGYHTEHVKRCSEMHIWYANKKMWQGFGVNCTDFATAIEGAQRDGWMHAS